MNTSKLVPIVAAILIIVGILVWYSKAGGHDARLDRQLLAAVDNLKPNPSEVRSLLVRGADPNMREQFTTATPLMRAAEAGNVEIVEILIAKGADAKAEAHDGTTALKLATKPVASRNRARFNRVIEMLKAAGATK